MNDYKERYDRISKMVSQGIDVSYQPTSKDAFVLRMIHDDRMVRIASIPYQDALLISQDDVDGICAALKQK